MKRIGRYEIVGRLGRGGMSTVYKAKAPVTNRLVALKVLRPRDTIFEDLVGAARLKEIFVEEARIMGAFAHDHVAKIIDCDEEDGRPFIVLEYFAHSIGSLIGESYRVEKPSRIISIKKTKSYLLQTLKGLERLHFARIIHRDIKPYNLMLTADDRVKIIDFGFSRVRGEEKIAIPGMQVGSPYYTAPEQEKNPQAADAKADLYSVGVLAYRMLTGNLFDYRKKIEPPSACNSEVSRRWDEVIFKAIARNPADRFVSCQEFQLGLEPLSTGPKRFCRRAEGDRAKTKVQEQGVRAKPSRVMYKDIRGLLNLDELLTPFSYNVPEFQVVAPMVAYDRKSRLFWQRRGSGFTLSWQQAKEYVAYLNVNGWQGRSNWRLPTVEELWTILGPPVHDVGCSSWPLFDSSIHWLWSCDYCTKKQAWMVDVVENFFDRLDKDGVASVCAVSSGEGEE